MILKNKVAVIYGAAGAIGSTIAQAFAREGAHVFLTGRSIRAVDELAKVVNTAGGRAQAAQLDALDELAVEAHLNGVVNRAGKIDISFNAIGLAQTGIQGISLAQLSLESFMLPLNTYLRSHFLTARAAVRRMVEKKSGVILMHTPEPARLGAPLVGGMAPAWAALEALSRDLSAEFGSQGIRSLCLRTTGIPETATIELVFGLHASAIGIPREQFQALLESMSHTRRSTTLEELAHAAVFAASDRASGMTGAVVNLTGGRIAD